MPDSSPPSSAVANEPNGSRVLYVITAKYDGRDWRQWDDEYDSYLDAASDVQGFREQYPQAKFRVIERTITDTITEA